MLPENANTTTKVRYMERYDYLYRTIVRQRFTAKNFGAVWAKDMGTMRARTNTEKEKSDLLQIPIISTFSTSGLANTKTMDDHVITKEMTMNIAVTAYTAASIDDVKFQIEQVWEAIDAGKESTYDNKVITIAKEKREAFNIALFNSTYYTLMCERNKKTVLEALHDYFFNPQGARLNVELKRCQRRIASDDEKLQQQKDELKAYKSRTDAAERAAEDARNRYASIQSKVETQQKQISDLEEKLRALQEENERLREEVPAVPVEAVPVTPAELEVDYAEKLKKVFAAKKIVIIGGHPNIMTKFAQKYPDAAVIEKDKAMTADKQLDGATAVLFKTDSMGHKEYTPIKDLAGRKGVPVGYICDVTSMNLVEKSVYEELKQLSISE
jgi:archaellum component FlaC